MEIPLCIYLFITIEETLHIPYYHVIMEQTLPGHWFDVVAAHYFIITN